jgi:hypothetical protein
MEETRTTRSKHSVPNAEGLWRTPRRRTAIARKWVNAQLAAARTSTPAHRDEDEYVTAISDTFSERSYLAKRSDVARGKQRAPGWQTSEGAAATSYKSNGAVQSELGERAPLLANSALKNRQYGDNASPKPRQHLVKAGPLQRSRAASDVASISGVKASEEALFNEGASMARVNVHLPGQKPVQGPANKRQDADTGVASGASTTKAEVTVDRWENAVGGDATASLQPKGLGRLRARGKVTHEAEKIMGLLDEVATAIEDGGKTSPRHVGRWFRHLYAQRVRPVGIRSIISRSGRDGDEVAGADPAGKEKVAPEDALVAVTVEEQADVLLVSLRLLSRLVNYMAFRPRNAGTPLLLRTKAAQYSKEMDLEPEQLSCVIHGCIAVAMTIPEIELRSMRAISGRAADLISGWSERLRLGILRDQTVWERLVGTASKWSARVFFGGCAVFAGVKSGLFSSVLFGLTTFGHWVQTVVWLRWHVSLIEIATVLLYGLTVPLWLGGLLGVLTVVPAVWILWRALRPRSLVVLPPV